MIKELDLVVLQCPLPDYGLAPGDIGTILSGSPDHGYEVEFSTLAGEPLAVVCLAPEDVREIGAREVAHARALPPPSPRQPNAGSED